ncbi:Alpha/Beta hydrolase protein [Flammula alnicola]|nr:Alpha/Beta hydrolase protein [Flammula alnicola]
MSPSTTTPEKYLDLPDGRTLAYSDIGDSSSSSLIIFFHGALNVGNATRLPAACSDKGVHYIAPTLPGWGKSSPRKKHVPYYISLASDITALIEHLHPHDSNLKIYIVGGSFGTVPAQMLYGAPFDIFPFGRHVVGCMLLGPFSPFKLHKEHTKAMTMQTYFAVGPPSIHIPFKLLQRLASIALNKTTKTTGGAEAWLHKNMFDNMEAEERAAYAKWRAEEGVEEGQLEWELADLIVRSVQETWEGFYEISDIIHGDWGFRPDALDDGHHVGRPIFIVAGEGDTVSPDAMAKWLAEKYKNSHYRSITGGHLAALFHINELWKEFFSYTDEEVEPSSRH